MLTLVEIIAMIVVIIMTAGLVLTALQDYSRGTNESMSLKRRQFYDMDDR
jgi:type II secretory pathway pseudopilin PulG